MKKFFTAILLFGLLNCIAQSGPGGNGTTDGTSNLVLWLRADIGVLNGGATPATNGQTVATWQDQSGNGYHAIGVNSPAFTASNASFNSQPTITLVEADDDYLRVEDDADEAPELDNTSELSIFFVFNSNNSSGTRGLLSKRDGNASAQSYVFYESSTINSRVNSNNDAGATITGGTTYINSLTYQNGDFNHWLNQVSGGGNTGGTAAIPNNNSDLNIGEFNTGDGRTFGGNFSEIIVFREYLSNAQRIVIESYLASKYGITIANDFWNQATYASYNNEIAGIGQHTDGTVANSATSSVLTISGGSDRGNGEWLFWGRDGGDFTTYTSTEIVTGSSQLRLAREWVINETGELGDVTVSFDAADIPSTGLASPNMYLLVDTDGNANFSNATAYLMTLNGSSYEVTLDLDEGDRLAIAFEPPIPANVSGTVAFWFDASVGVENGGMQATDGQNVTVWQDLSSNNVDGQNGTSPSFSTSAAVNYHPVVQFDAASSEYLEFGMTSLQGADYTMMAVVQRSSGTGSQYILGSQTNAADALLLGYSANAQVDARNSNTASVSSAVSAFNTPVTSPSIVAVNYNSVDLRIDEFRDGNIATATTATSTDYAATGYTGNIGRALSGNNFDGSISEIVAFSTNLSTADYNALATNLAIKHGVNLGMDYVDEMANVLWDFSDNTGYTSAVVGIGTDDSFLVDQRIAKSAADELVLATTADFISLNEVGSRTSLSDGQFAFISNDGDPIALTGTYNSVANARVDRVWRMREVGNPGSLIVAIPSAVVDVNVLLVSTDPTFATGVSEVSLSTSGTYVYGTYNFSDGDYFTFVSDPSEIWYSYQSGNWTNPTSWTLDGAISALYVNPSGRIPAAGDSVVIKSGRTITMDMNGSNITKLELVGTLDLGATFGHNFNYLEGNGTLRLAGNVGVDNYPMANDTLFYDNLEGGTVEYYGSGVTISEIRRYNNLIVNLDVGSNIFTMLSDSIYVYSDLTIQRGIFQMNDNGSTNNLAIEIFGSALIDASGGLDVGTANARHQFDLYGDFTNYGNAYFTNRTSQTTGSEATNGIIDFNLLSDYQDQTITLENITHFYRIEIDKGTDATYMADFNASDPSYFELYGYANEGHGTIAQLITNNNALGLISGIARLGTNIDIGTLSNGTNYNISEGAQLWIDGGSAFKNTGTAIVPYGSIRVTAGSLQANVNSGITSRANGTVFLEGGTITMRQFRTSIYGATNQGGIVMSGGIMNITGQTSGGIDNNYYPLNLTYSGNVFNLSGGILNVSGANTKGGVFINSDPENISVTGGVVNFISTNTNPFLITSRAPFFDLNLTKTFATGGNFLVGTGQSGPNGTDETIENLPLVIENDLNIDNADGNTVSFDPQDNDVQITGSLTVTNGSSVDFTNMKLIIAGTGSSQLNIGLSTPLVLDSLQINKSNEYVNVDISSGPIPAIQINEYLDMTSGNLDVNSFNIQVLGNINASDTVGTVTSTGLVIMNGSSAQTITSTNGAIYDLEINNANGVTQSGGFSVPGQLALNAGILGIGTSQLTLGLSPTTSGTFSSSLMIQTAGNASDGGLSMYFDGTAPDPGAILYPLGTNANSTVRYTPALVDLSGISDDGYVRIRMSDTQLQTVDLTALSNNMLTYYWRVSHSGFSTLPNVDSYTFSGRDSDDPDGGTTPSGYNANFVPGKVLDELPFTRSQENTSDITGFNIRFNGAGAGFSIENANYTAGNGSTTLFTGTPEVYYSRVANGNWVNFSANSSWSRISHTGAAATDYPRNGDIAIIGSTYTGGGTGRHQIAGVTGAAGDITIAALIFNSQAGGSALNVTDMSRLRIRGNRTLNVGTVSGTGEMVQDIGNASQMATIIGDLGEFLEEDDNGWFFWFQSAVDVTITDRFTYPIFRTFGNTGTLTFSQDVTAHGVVIDSDTELRVTTNYTIDSLVQIGSNLSGTLAFRNVGTNLTFETGSIYYSNDANNNIAVQNAGSDIHRLIVNGDINLTAGTGFNLTSAAGAQVELELSGVGNHYFTNNTGSDAEFYRVIMNKGVDTTSVFTINDDFNLNGPTNTEPPALELLKGKLVLNDAAIDVELGDGIDFYIPEGAGLEITQGNVTSDNSVLILDGLLRINGGTATFSNTDIEYSNTGYALIDVDAGSFEVGDILRRAITTSTGVLKYRQSGGTVLIASNSAPSYSPSRAAFEVTNTGSEFILTGGSFTIQRGVTGTNNISLLLTPETYNVTGSTIILGNTSTPSYSATYFNLKTSIPLHNLTIFDDADDNLPPVRLMSYPLTLNGTLDISSNAGFVANGFNVILNGDLNNSGLFQNQTATTTLGATVSQNITGAGTFTLYNLVKNGAGTATTNQNLSLLRDLTVNQGILNIQTNSLSLRNDAYVRSTIQNSSGNGLVFNGIANQDLYGVANQTMSIGTITIQNSAGVDIPDGNGYNFDITRNLRLNGGVFNIGGSLVTVKRGAVITEVSPFNVNNMVQTNSSYTDNGFRQEFYGVAADTVIFFPVGELKYTPVQFAFDAGTTQGSIRVRPANEMHPTVIDNTEPVTEAEIVDSDNALQYYWVVLAESLTNASGNATFYYDHGDIRVTAPYDTSHYISGRLLSNGVNWDKFDPTLFLGANQTFIVPFSSATSSEITGDYTSGVGSSDGLNNDIEGALPDEIAQYDSNYGGAGNYSTDASWTPLGSSPVLTSNIGPVGAQVTVLAGDDVTMNLSSVRLYATHIEEGAILRIPNGSIGNRLGTVTGNGTIVLTDTELLPSGEYSAFLACDGGALQYSGSTSYNVLSGISQIRKVVFDGTGTRIMPNNALDVCDTLVVNGPTVSFNTGQTYNIGNSVDDLLSIQSGVTTISNSTTLNVTGDFEISGGTLNGNSGSALEVTGDVERTGGALNWNNLSVRLDGSVQQFINGDFTGTNAFDRLRINNSSVQGVTIGSGDVEIDAVLTFQDGLLNTTSSETLILNATATHTGASSASYVTGPISKRSVLALSTFSFPVGKAARYAPAAVANVGTGGDTWTAEYFTSTNPTYSNASFDPVDPGSGKNALIRVQSTDRWQVTSAGSNTAQVRVAYDAHNNFENEESIRVVWWDGAGDLRWENRGAIVTGTPTSGSVISEDVISFSTQQFGLGYAPETIVPVELVFFDAIAQDNRVQTSWQTATEKNNDYFELQRSHDGRNYEVLTIVQGAGDSDELLNYSFVDNSPYLGISYYRLRQVDYDGKFEIFPAKVVYNDIIKSGTELNIHPNPTNPTNINFEVVTGDDHTPMTISMIDISGRLMYQRELNPEDMVVRDRIIPIGITKGGLYFVTLVQGNEVIIKKLIIKE